MDPEVGLWVMLRHGSLFLKSCIWECSALDMEGQRDSSAIIQEYFIQSRHEIET